MHWLVDFWLEFLVLFTAGEDKKSRLIDIDIGICT